jgi:hypothetical protein
MLQALITRMAGYGASFKSYCITVTTAVIGFAFTLHRPAVAALALLPVIAFGVADAQYLRVERRFRAVFNRVRAESWDAMPSFDIKLESAPKQSFLNAITSWSIVWFYGTAGSRRPPRGARGMGLWLTILSIRNTPWAACWACSGPSHPGMPWLITFHP